MGKETLLHLSELSECLAKDIVLPKIEEDSLIVPFYVEDGKRLELYHYEFTIWGNDAAEFEDFILEVSGKNKLEEIPSDLMRIREICFSKMNGHNQNEVVDRIKFYFRFLLIGDEVNNEIENVFGKFDSDKLFICIY